MTTTWLEQLRARSDLLHLQTPKESGTSFVHYDRHKRRIRLDYFWQPVDKRLYAAVLYGPEAEGPPGCAHGGSIAAVMDDAMGTAAWASGHRVVALNLHVDFRKFVVLNEEFRIQAWVDRRDGRKIFARAHIAAADGTIHAEGQGLFYEIDFDKLLERRPDGPVA